MPSVMENKNNSFAPMIFQKLENFFLAKYKKDNIELFNHARLMLYACIITAAFAVLYAAVSVVISFRPGIMIMSADALSFLLIALLLRYSKSTIFLANLYVLFCWLPITSLTFFSGGIYSSILPWIVIVPVAGNLIVNRKFAWFWLAITLAAVLGFSLLQISNVSFGYHYNRDLEIQFYTIVYMGLALIILILTIVFDNEKLLAQNKIIEKNLEIAKNNAELERLSITDNLTQLFNRNKISEVFNYEIKQLSRRKNDLSLILMDIDNFKKVNDTYGHLIGDRFLVELSKLLIDSARSTDTIGRWGGEEFIIIAPNTDIDGIMGLAEKFRRNIEKFNFTGVGKSTCSFGITTYATGDTELDMFNKADRALYNAKDTGKNRVCSL